MFRLEFLIMVKVMNNELLNKINRSQCSIFKVKNAVDRVVNDDLTSDLKCVYTIQSGTDVSELCDTIFKDNSIEDNISFKNPHYCESTVIYWIWKNIKSNYVGLCHYRRLFDLTDEMLDSLIEGGYDVILPEPLLLYPNIETQYKNYHYTVDWDIMMNVLNEISPEYYITAKDVFNKNIFYPYCMGIYKKTYFDEYCEWLFPIIDEIFKRCKTKNDVYQNRYIAFLTERLHGLYFLHNKNNIKYTEVKVKLLKSEDKFISYNDKIDLTSDEFKDLTQQMLDNGKIEAALGFFKDNSEHIEKNEDIDIICKLYNIYSLEKRYEEKNIFSSARLVDDLISIYINLKFLLRRYEFEFVYDNELYEFIHKYNITYIAVLYVLNLHAYNKPKVLTSISIDLFNNGMVDFSLNILLYGFREYSNNNMILYTLALIFYNIGDYQNAFIYVEKISIKSSDIQELKRKIKEELTNNG